MNVPLFTEQRTAQLVDFDLKGMDFRGKVAAFDKPWDPRMTEKAGYEEIVKRGAFSPALKATPYFPLLREHDPHQLLATTRAGTMRAYEDDDAFICEATLPNTALGEETRALIDRGDLHGMSYGVRSARGDSTINRSNGVVQRAIHAFREMIDVSITWDPTYPDSGVELRGGFTFATLDDLGIRTAKDLDPSGTAARLRAVTIDNLERGFDHAAR